MGNDNSKSLEGDLVPSENITEYSRPIFGRDIVSLIVRSDELSLSDFYHCSLVCKMWKEICLTDEMWLLRLKIFIECGYPGRLGWNGYQLINRFFNEDFAPHVSKITTGNKTWKNIFQTKRIIKERFDLYTGWVCILATIT